MINIRIVGVADPAGARVCNETGTYVVSYDPDLHDGLGYFETTADVAKAKLFKDAHEAVMFWRQTSKIRPLRPDGQPNRPLTAFTIELSTAPVAP